MDNSYNDSAAEKPGKNDGIIFLEHAAERVDILKEAPIFLKQTGAGLKYLKTS